MSNFEEQTTDSRKNDFEKTETSLEEIKKTSIGDLSLEELQALVAKRQELAGEKETIVEVDHGEALGMEESRNVAAAEAAQAEQAKQEAARQAEEKAASEAADAAKVEALLAQIKGGEVSQAEMSAIDAVALNNKIVRIREPKEQQAAIEALTDEEVAAVAKSILESAPSSFGHLSVYDGLSNFKFDKRIMSQPAVVEALSIELTAGKLHLYDVDRMLQIPNFPDELLSDPGVHAGIVESARNFFSYKPALEFQYVWKVLDKANLSSEELRSIAESMKEKTNEFHAFATHVGVKRIYPEVQ